MISLVDCNPICHVFFTTCHLWEPLQWQVHVVAVLGGLLCEGDIKTQWSTLLRGLIFPPSAWGISSLGLSVFYESCTEAASVLVCASSIQCLSLYLGARPFLVMHLIPWSCERFPPHCVCYRVPCRHTGGVTAVSLAYLIRPSRIFAHPKCVSIMH